MEPFHIKDDHIPESKVALETKGGTTGQCVDGSLLKTSELIQRVRDPYDLSQDSILKKLVSNLG